MNKDERIPFSLQYGLQEDEILKQVDELAKEGILPKSRNEIFRRGLHACRYLSEVNEGFSLSLLSQTLHKLSKYYFPVGLQLAKDLALTIYAIKISKYGTGSAETFETIVNTLKIYERVTKKKDIGPDQEKALYDSLKKLADSVDTIFLEPLKIDKESGMSMYLSGLFGVLLTGELEKAEENESPTKIRRRVGLTTSDRSSIFVRSKTKKVSFQSKKKAVRGKESIRKSKFRRIQKAE